jgi:protein-S-isoprenylcysteine O-methyltransferase Ste14
VRVARAIYILCMHYSLDSMALVFLGLYVLLAFGWRSWAQYRRTGSTGFRGLSGRPGSLEWFGGALLVAGMIALVLAPVASIAGWLPGLAIPGAAWPGGVLVVGGTLFTLAAQWTMGTSWRIGVDPSERTALVTSGLFGRVRNPIFTGMIAASAGFALWVPNLAALLGVVATVAGLEIQVRLVEEPYLARVHGAAYRAYAARAGRFVPWLGRGLHGDAGERAFS